MRLKKSTVALIMMLLALPLIALAAQTKPDEETEACPALVQQALNEVGTACDALDRNSACYGYDRVAAVFAREVQEDEFTRPSDRVSLVDLRAIQTAPMDVESGEWGVAVMNVLANVPNSIPGQGVVFLLMGNVTLGNGVEPTDSVQPAAQPLTVYTTTAARIRSGAGLNFNTIGGAPANTPLAADGRSEDAGWVRIVYGNAPAWISTIVIRTDGDINSLPVMSDESRTPMQAFYFSTGLGTPACTEAPPSTLLVQGPDRFEVELTVNGVDVMIGSTIGLRTMENSRAQLFVVDGEALVNGELRVPLGHSVDAPIDLNGLVAGDWENWRILTPDEFAQLAALANIPPNLLNYPIDPPTEAEARAAEARPTAVATNPPPPPSSQTQEPAPPATQEPAPAGTCSSVNATSPTGGMAYGFNTFYWDPVPGADSYQVSVVNLDNGQGTGGSTSGTSLTLDLSGLGSGFNASWSVAALSGGQVICGSGNLTMLRELPSPTPQQISPEEQCRLDGGQWSENGCYFPTEEPPTEEPPIIS